MSAREGAAGQIRVATTLRLEGAALGVAGVVSGMRLSGIEEVGSTIRVPQGHGVVRGVAGHRVVVTTAAGQAFHCHRGQVNVHIQLLLREVCTGPKTSSSLLSQLRHVFSPVINSRLLVLRACTSLHLVNTVDWPHENRLESNPLNLAEMFYLPSDYYESEFII